MVGIFGEFFLVSVSHERKHEKSSKNAGKIRSKTRGKIRDENSKNSGNFRSATFLTLRLHTNNRLKGTHWVRSQELSEPRKTHWVRCLKPYSPKPYSARFRMLASWPVWYTHPHNRSDHRMYSKDLVASLQLQQRRWICHWLPIFAQNIDQKFPMTPLKVVPFSPRSSRELENKGVITKRSFHWKALQKSDIFMIFQDLGPIISGVAPTNQTKGRKVHELFTGAFRNKS